MSPEERKYLDGAHKAGGAAFAAEIDRRVLDYAYEESATTHGLMAFYGPKHGLDEWLAYNDLSTRVTDYRRAWDKQHAMPDATDGTVGGFTA